MKIMRLFLSCLATSLRGERRIIKIKHEHANIIISTRDVTRVILPRSKITSHLYQVPVNQLDFIYRAHFLDTSASRYAISVYL